MTNDFNHDIKDQQNAERFVDTFEIDLIDPETKTCVAYAQNGLKKIIQFAICDTGDSYDEQGVLIEKMPSDLNNIDPVVMAYKIVEIEDDGTEVILPITVEVCYADNRENYQTPPALPSP